MDCIAATCHDTFAREDYDRVRNFGMQTVREGLRWHLIAAEKGKLNFESAEVFLQAAQEKDIEIIWDLFHFGWPDYLDIFSPEWVDALAALAYGFSCLLLKKGISAPFIAPCNEISFVAWGGGDVACIEPYERGRGPELKRQLVRGALAAIRIIRDVLPGARIVSPEPLIHLIGRPEVPGDVQHAEQYRQAMFESWDMLLGRAFPELGGIESAVDVLGVNFYDRNESISGGAVLLPGDAQYRPFREILAEAYQRFQRPLFVSETGTEDRYRPEWFRYIADEVRAAREMGIPVEGLCLYPVVNHPGWEDDRHCCNGLWDYCTPSGAREIYEPLAQEIRRNQF